MKSLIALGGVLALASSVWAGPALNMLVEDRVLGYIDVPSVPGLKQRAALSPFAKMWKDEKLQKFIAPLLEKVEFEKLDERLKQKTGQGLAEWSGIAKGELLIAFDHADKTELVPYLLLDIGGDTDKMTETFKKIFTSAEGDPEQFEQKEEEIAGVIVHEVVTLTKSKNDEGEDTTRPRSTFWIAHDGVFAAVPERSIAAELAASLTRGSAQKPLGRTNSYQKAAMEFSGEGIRTVVDFNQLTPFLSQSIKEGQGGRPVAPMMEPDAILSSLGLGEMDLLSLSLRFDENSLSTLGSFSWRKEKGLIKLIALKPGPVAQPAFVPESWFAVSVAKYSLPDVFVAVKEAFQAHHPTTAGIFAGAIATANAQLGFDLERDLFGSLGEDVVVARVARPGIPLENLSVFDLDEFFAISLTNPKTFSTVLDGFLKRADPQNRGVVVNRDYLGTTIHVIPIGPDALQRPRSAALCIWQNQFFVSVGSPSAIEAAIRNGTEKGPTAWGRPEVKAAFEKVPAQCSAFSFQDNRVAMAMALETFVQAFDAAAGKGGEPLLDRSSQPTPDDLAQYWDFAYGYATKDSQGAKFVSIVPYLP